MYDITPKNKDGMNIRSEHNTTSAIVGSLDFGVHAKGDFTYEIKADGEAKDAKLGDQWLHITSPVIGWVAVVHNGTLLSTVTQGDVPPASKFPDKVRWTDLDTNEFADYERIVKP